MDSHDHSDLVPRIHYIQPSVDNLPLLSNAYNNSLYFGILSHNSYIVMESRVWDIPLHDDSRRIYHMVHLPK